MTSIEINQRKYLEVEKLSIGAFSPLTKFMDKKTLEEVSSNMRLPTGEIFPLPVVFDVPIDCTKRIESKDILNLTFEAVARMKNYGQLYQLFEVL
ncbi:hypothetical protein [Methanoplanus endosymbiosus]|uniref:hypothetical protein n=1 Tax=Methanoplanus endosymbiosus TaxID=33865 RepID=UPI00214F99B9|nr:hypothetical protein [Methanoplanus endosymbiosus]